MAAISGDDTKVSTNARTPAHLESIETANFETGDLAWVESVRRYYMLDKLSRLTRDGVNVLYTLNSAPRFNGGQSGPGRWVVWVPSGPPGATGPTGPAGASGATGPTGPEGAGFITDFVFRPGDPDPAPNTFTDWGQLVATASTIDGPKSVYMSDRYQPVVIPAGDWNLGGGATTFMGSPRRLLGTPMSPIPVEVTLSDGVRLTGVHFFENVRIIVQNSDPSEPVIRTSRESGVGNLFVLSYIASIVVQGAGDFIHVDVPNTIGALLIQNFTSISSSGSGGLVFRATTPTSQGVVLVFDIATLNANTVGAVAPSVIAVVGSAAASVDTNQPALPGGTIPIALTPRAMNVDYNQSAAPSIDAQTVQVAIDRLKSLPAQTGNLGAPTGIGLVDTPIISLPTLVAPINAPVDLDASLSINDPAPGNDVNFFYERSLDGGGTWNQVSANYIQTTLSNNVVSITARDFVAPGDNVIYRVTARANGGAPVATAGFMRAKMTVEGP